MDKAIVLIGATGQVGRALSAAAKKLDYNLLLVARNIVSLRCLDQDIAELGRGKTKFVAADVGHPDGLRKAIETAESAFGAVGTIINGAAIATKEPVFDVSDHTATALLRTNIIGTLNTIKIGAQFLRKNGGGHITIRHVESCANPFNENSGHRTGTR
jgi:short-subunit dehydrogenase